MIRGNGMESIKMVLAMPSETLLSILNSLDTDIRLLSVAKASGLQINDAALVLFACHATDIMDELDRRNVLIAGIDLGQSYRWLDE
jgi:hypothetical protein